MNFSIYNVNKSPYLEELSRFLNYPIDFKKESHYDGWLLQHENRLKLELNITNNPQIYIDFEKGRFRHIQKTIGKHQIFAKAIGVNKGYKKVWDLTAGFFRDSFSLLTLGCEVTGVERNPLIYSLAKDACRHYSNSDLLSQNLKMFCEDSFLFLQKKHNSLPEVIFLDPMFSKISSAASCKEMEFLKNLLGHSREEAKKLLEQSLEKAQKRVVMKRSRKEKPLINPSHSFVGKSVVYDMYLLKK